MSKPGPFAFDPEEIDWVKWRWRYAELPKDSERKRVHWESEARILGINASYFTLSNLKEYVKGRRELRQ